MFNVNFLGDLEKKKITTMKMDITTILYKVVCISLKTQFVPKNINALDFVMKMKTNS
jgi:hypothetical protein